MPNFNAEMLNLPIGQVFSNTMDALIDGQYAASLHSLDLFQRIAYDTNGDLNTMEIKYHRMNPDYDPNATNPTSPTIAQKIEFPTFLAVPYQNLSIAHVDWEFNVELNSHEYQKIDTNTEMSASLDFRARLGWWGQLNIKGRIAHQKKTLSGSDVKRRYGMNVKARIVREEAPEIIQKVTELIMEGMQPVPVQ